MDQKKIGAFLRMLRKEKEITQEQLAEKFGVSGRTVSRWENGNNMPDLAVIIQIAEYFDIEVRELLEGERKGASMNKEMNETLKKVADYSKIEKEKYSKIAVTSFCAMYIVGAFVIIFQLAMGISMTALIGENIMFIIGGATYLFLMVNSGIWELERNGASSKKRDVVISIIFADIFALTLWIVLQTRYNVANVELVVLSFACVMTFVNYFVLRILSRISRKRKNMDA